jgi:predicted ATPase
MVQRGLADLFIDVAKKRNVQIIVKSHSEHMLCRLQRRVAEGQLSKDQRRFISFHRRTALRS